ncbi:MAG TPA: carbamoyltransferase HypF [Elusimicrobiales bacterium]|nr:carbamoyltransferase HypF [Elusimicrobiales bacterium]
MPVILRKRITVKGVVQGVGFRPHVFKLAAAYALSGWVKNDAAGVTIEAEGAPGSLAGFIRDIGAKKPAAARVDSVAHSALRPAGGKNFRILKSGGRAQASAIIPADLALCEDCRREMADPADRRYLYPFTNCTNCGPRFTIVRRVPYDRPFTTMAPFKMCPACRAEYENPLDRRFHAQPNACPACGPALSFEERGRTARGGALVLAAARLAAGKIGAIQSLGGFHLACSALDHKAVGRLRAIKDRPHKPFALMFADLAAARRYCVVSPAEAAVLGSSGAPVVMVRKRPGSALALAAPALGSAGIMLPYTPLHAALFAGLSNAGFSGPLIMTSGNFRDEPIARTVAEVRSRLGRLADFTVYHDREIHNRADDSVGFVAGGVFRFARRARGFVPGAIKLAAGKAGGVLAAGADLKNSFCLTRGNEAFLSQHIGDLAEPGNQAFYLETLGKMKKLLRAAPRTIAFDLHPDYASSAAARGFKGRKVPVQHHAAHVLSVAAEHGLAEPFIGLAFDGTGYGTDGKIWGSEFLVFENNSWRRAAHLKYFPLPGGDAATREIWRPAIALLRSALGAGWAAAAGKIAEGIPASGIAVVGRMLEAGFNCPESSGMGRLFDAFSCIAGVRSEATYEAQGPMEMESLYKGGAGAYPFSVERSGGEFIIDPAPAVRAALADRLAGRCPGYISGRFHRGVAAMAAAAAARLSASTGIKNFCLSGGVFQNRVLLELVTAGLERRGYKVFTNIQAPANDGGVALGQAWYAIKGYRQA